MGIERYIPDRRIEINRDIFRNENCSFRPYGWVQIDGLTYPVGFKVVDENRRSLGLRKNPNIMTFPEDEWVLLPEEQMRVGGGDWGGIWSALSKGNIKTLKNYCWEKYGMKTRAYWVALYNPVFANSYRIKSQGVRLMGEIV